jgi:hypothetical protein
MAAPRFLWLVVFALAVTSLRVVPAIAQAPMARFWLAGRYDGNRIVVFFDAVKFKGTVPRTTRTLAEPATLGFLSQKELPADYVAQFLRKSGAERFQTGDQYDLFMGDGRTTTVTLTTLVGYVSDDEDDDPSYLGALARVNQASALVGTRGYYALQRHNSSGASSKAPSAGAQSPAAGGPKESSGRALGASRTFAPPPESNRGIFASLFDEPVRFDLETQIAALLTERMHELASVAQQREAENLAPTLAVQSLRLADGSLRYYARAEWRAEETPEATPVFAMGAWIAPSPVLHILALEEPTSPYGFLYELPTVLNVVDLGGGNTGIIADISGSGDSRLGLWEYRDGANLNHMRLFQSLVMDE